MFFGERRGFYRAGGSRREARGLHRLATMTPTIEQLLTAQKYIPGIDGLS